MKGEFKPGDTISWERLADELLRVYGGQFDMIDFQEQYSDELFETGSVTARIGDGEYEISMHVKFMRNW